MVVYKYPFQITNEFIIDMPRNAEILHVDEQHSIPCMWALIDTTEPMMKRRFKLVGTGHTLEHAEYALHIGSFFQAGGALVWHLFDCGESNE